MTFSALRQHVLQSNALSTDWFAEEVEYTDRGDETATTVVVKIEVETKIKTNDREGRSARPLARNQEDGRERIRVMVSRIADDPSGSVTTTPAVGAKLLRSESRDPDQRPYLFAGEVIAEEQFHAVYVFERSRRVIDSRGT